MVKKSRMIWPAQKYHTPRGRIKLFDRESDGLRSSKGHSSAVLLSIGTDQPVNQFGNGVVQLVAVVSPVVRQQTVMGKQVADRRFVHFDRKLH